jgi:predicted ribosome quality control (RQC) complex YloA/Tae2 family protein
MEVRIDLRKSIPENAEGYYRRSKKARKKIPGLKKAIEETKARLREVGREESKPVEPAIKKKRKRRWFEGYRWFYSSDGFLVVGGRDAGSNESLIKKHLEGHDLVFHADIQGAPFFIVKNPAGVEVPENTVREAAEAAGSYSRAWGSGMGSCSVYYVRPEQVSKTPPAGEYLPKGAFMIRGRKNWVRDVELKLAVGFIVNDGVEVVGGPPSSVSAKTRYHAVISVGDVKSKKLAEDIVKTVLRKTPADAGRLIKRIKADEIQTWIPAGRGRLIKG